ncbi:hypothetical protein FSP39_018080 [Pinctada imbricata]|uniref:Protein ABHD13 n=1 Tax=Pinctada imbricata TaxID=66713 RepID=A0AA88XMX3_PINIB|nr:hypothetical protein FSP39_018080 [Pinctada imbricata]
MKDQDDRELLIPVDTEDLNKNMGNGFRTIELVTFLVLAVLKKFWKLCTSLALILLLTFWYYGGLLTLFLLMFALFGTFYNAQDMLLYYPDQPSHARLFVEQPSIMKLPFENHHIKTKDGVKINIVLIKHANPNAPTFIYFHGNAGNIGHRLPNAQGLHSLCGFNVLLVEYRGYGKSEGSPSESGLYLDAEAAMEFVLQRNDINKNKLLVFGRSLGGAVAIWLASQSRYTQHISVLIIENTFTSLPDIAKKIFDFYVLNLVPEFLYKNKFPSLRRIENIKIPTLFLSGMRDTLIPPKMMQKLHMMSAASKKQLSRFEDGTHNETWMCNGYYESLSRFVSEVLGSRAMSQANETEPRKPGGTMDV